MYKGSELATLASFSLLFLLIVSLAIINRHFR